jgi:hypothetical protein
MHVRRERERERERKKTCIGKERTINKINLIILNILEKPSGLIIPNRGSTLVYTCSIYVHKSLKVV